MLWKLAVTPKSLPSVIRLWSLYLKSQIMSARVIVKLSESVKATSRISFMGYCPILNLLGGQLGKSVRVFEPFIRTKSTTLICTIINTVMGNSIRGLCWCVLFVKLRECLNTQNTTTYGLWDSDMPCRYGIKISMYWQWCMDWCSHIDSQCIVQL